MSPESGELTWRGQYNVWICSQFSKLCLHGVSTDQHSQPEVCVPSQLLDRLM